MSPRRFIDALLEGPKKSGALADYEAEVLKIVGELRKMGYYVETDAPTQSVKLSFEEDPEGEATELVSGKKAKIVVHDPDDEENVTYDMYPHRRGEKAWKREFDQLYKRGNFSKSDLYSRTEDAEKLLNSYGYDLGGAGGGNWDLSKSYGNTTVTFCMWANPYHM
jgi:hypothetical protein